MESVSQTVPDTNAIIHVMLVDDSAVVRGLMSRALQKDAEIQVVVTASDGEMALRVLPRHDIDVIVLDIEMPNMDGITALPKLLELSPNTKVIMASTLTHRNADISMKAMEMGASDYVPKPSSQRDMSEVENFYRELTDKVKALGATAQEAKRPHTIGSSSASLTTAQSAPAAPSPKSIQTRSVSNNRIEAIAIASSTGGPQALMAALTQMKHIINDVPVFVTQHMPPTFTTLLAEHLTRDSGCQCIEVKDAQATESGVVHIAPGDYHMQFRQESSGEVVVALNQNPQVNFCRPAADPMIESLLDIYGSHLLVIVLTGMGNDGLGGAKKAAEIGAPVIAQDQASSVVWGMPRAVAEAGLASAVLPLDEIGEHVAKMMGTV